MFNLKRRFLFRLFAIILILTVCFSSILVCSAEDLPYYSYRYENNDGTKKYATDKPMYKVDKMLSGETFGIKGFSEIGDIYTDKNNYLYVLDSGNNRIVILDSNYNLKNIIEKFSYKGKNEILSKPQGLFVTDGGEIYIADTENSRIVICNKKGEISEILTTPESNLIPDEFDFFPIKIICDKNGFMYVLTRGSYYGAMLFDTDRQFLGFFGANTVVTSVLDGISAMFSRLFETNAKLAVSAKKLPFQFSDFVIDKEGFFYTVSNNAEKKTGQIRKLNLPGNDILTYNDGENNVSSTEYNFGEIDFYFDKTGRQYEQNFCSISVDNNGYIFSLDNIYGKIYVYDSACNSITVFGGGMSQGNQKGTFSYPTAIENNGEDLLVADAHTNEITVFSLTEYGKLVRTANDYTLANEHIKAEPIWKEVLKYSSDSTLAYSGLTKAALLFENYGDVFEYSKKSNDKESYGIAFDMLKKDYIANNLWWISLLVMTVIVVFIILKIQIKKREIVIIKSVKLKNCFKCMIHPFDGFEELKYKKLGSKVISVIILVLFYVSAVGEKLWVGFMYSTSTDDFNIFYTLIGTIGVALLWVVVEWGVTALFQGKGRIGEIFCVTCYSLIPMIVYRLFYILYSYFFSPTGTSFLGIINTVFIIYTAVLLIVGLINIHEYTLGKVIGTSILTVLGMMIVTFVIFMMMSLFQNLIAFVVNVVSEVVYK